MAKLKKSPLALAVAAAIGLVASGCVETVTYAPVRQGETVEVNGGRLTALRWCGSAACRGGIAGRVVIWIKACATADHWDVGEADFLAGVRSTEDIYYSESISRPEALGQHSLAAGACAEGTLSFTMPERPEYLFYYGSGYRARWEMAARPAGGTGFHPIGPSGWNVAVDPPPAKAAVPRSIAASLECKKPGMRYVGTGSHGTFVCFTLSADGRELREASFEFALESQCPGEAAVTTHIAFKPPWPNVLANGRLHFDDKSNLFTGTVSGATAVGTFGEQEVCGTKRFGWRARRVR